MATFTLSRHGVRYHFQEHTRLGFHPAEGSLRKAGVALSFTSAEAARSFLLPWQADVAAIHRIRVALASRLRDIHLRGNKDVLLAFAEELTRGRFRVESMPLHIRGEAFTPETAEETSSSTATSQNEDTQEENESVNEDAQAAALESASEEGAPFCEECQKQPQETAGAST